MLPENTRKPFVFLVFSVGIKWEHWPERMNAKFADIGMHFVRNALYPRLELLLHKTLQTFLHMNLQTLAR